MLGSGTYHRGHGAARSKCRKCCWKARRHEGYLSPNRQILLRIVIACTHVLLPLPCTQTALCGDIANLKPDTLHSDVPMRDKNMPKLVRDCLGWRFVLPLSAACGWMVTLFRYLSTQMIFQSGSCTSILVILKDLPCFRTRGAPSL